jgi:hypothetical protein
LYFFFSAPLREQPTVKYHLKLFFYYNENTVEDPATRVGLVVPANGIGKPAKKEEKKSANVAVYISQPF